MERITVNLTPGGALGICHASQYDLGREIAYDLMDGDSVYTLDGTETVTMVIKRPDGVTVERAISNTSDSYVIWTSDEGDCDAAGIAECELRFTKGSQDLGSGNFLMLVEADPFNGAGVVVETVGPADICTFETTLAEPLQSVLVNVLATGGNGTPDNPNPINGYTEANIIRCGVNLFDNEFPDLDNTVRYKHIKTGNGTFTLSSDCPLPEGAACLFFLAGNVSSGASTATNGVSNGIPRTVTTSDGYVTIAYRYYGSNPTIYPSNYHTQLEKSSTATAYTPYTGNAYAIAFGQTVYGGVLDVTRGKLHVTWLYFKGGWSQYNASNGYKAYSHLSLSPAKTTYGPGLSNMVNEYGSFSSDNMTKNIIQLPNAVGQCFMALDENADPNNVEVAYELATPIDIDLTPEVISAVVGTNNVFADCGQTTVKYLKAGA